MTHPMIRNMFTTYRSQLDFDATVAAVQQRAEQNGWHVPTTFDIQAAYHDAGIDEMTRCTIIYLCDPFAGYKILQEDASKPMSVMMPTGVSVFETQDGEVRISAMNFGMMQMMFAGTKQQVLKGGADKMAATFNTIIAPQASGCAHKWLCLLVPVGLLAWWRRRRNVESPAATE